MSKQEKIDFVVDSICHFEGIEDALGRAEVRSQVEGYSDKTLQSEYDFMVYLWDK